MFFEDDRTLEQHQTHTLIVMGTDGFMSYWGMAQGGPSYAGWACTPETVEKTRKWVEARPEMKRVRIVMGNYRSPAGPGHCHIYVAHD